MNLALGKYGISSPTFERLRATNGMSPLAMTGPALMDYVEKAVGQYKKQAKDLSLTR